MAKKRHGNKRKTGKGKFKRKGRRTAATLSKNQKKAVKAIVDHKLDARIEDKFVRMPLGVSIEGSYSGSYGMVLQEITPQLVVGDTVSERTGLKVQPKFMRMNIQYIPQGYDSPFIDTESSNPVFSQGQLPPKIPLEVFVFRMVRKHYDSTPTNDLMQAINVKYRPAGLWKQDVLEINVPQETVRGLRLLKRAKLSSRYSSQIVRMKDDPALFHSRARVINCPLQSSAIMTWKFPSKNMLFENVNNYDANYVYFAAFRTENFLIDHAWTPSAAPTKLIYRTCFVYEDA